MTPTVDQAIEIIRQLPPPEREKVREWIIEDSEKEISDGDAKKAELEKRNEKFKRALSWVEANKEEYDGQFVLLEGDDLISSGSDPKELYETARSKGIKIPFVKRVKAKELPFGGW
jgi:hypothetical protein